MLLQTNIDYLSFSRNIEDDQFEPEALASLQETFKGPLTDLNCDMPGNQFVLLSTKLLLLIFH